MSGWVEYYDLVEWGIGKAHDPDSQPPWPLKPVLVADALFAGLFTAWFVLLVANALRLLTHPWRLYSALAVFSTPLPLFAAVLHGICFTMELRAARQICEHSWVFRFPRWWRRRRDGHIRIEDNSAPRTAENDI